jgi:Putative MetA-pathway of phenol degradation
MKSFKYFLSIFFVLSIVSAATIDGQQNEDEDYLSPVRPTISDSGKIQKKGVLQIEYGIDADYRAPDYLNRQTAPLGIYFAANKRLRLDLEVETFTSQRFFGRESGIGDVTLGFKTLLRTDPDKHLAVGFAYDIKLPSANENKNLGTGRVDHDVRVIFDRAYGKNDFIANFAYLNIGRNNSRKRASGTQVVLAYERELPKNFGAQFELIGNSVSASQPRGIYTLAALTYKISKRFVLDLGVHPGFGREAPKFSLFGGITLGAGNLLKKH